MIRAGFHDETYRPAIGHFYVAKAPKAFAAQRTTQGGDKILRRWQRRGSDDRPARLSTIPIIRAAGQLPLSLRAYLTGTATIAILINHQEDKAENSEDDHRNDNQKDGGGNHALEVFPKSQQLAALKRSGSDQVNPAQFLTCTFDDGVA